MDQTPSTKHISGLPNNLVQQYFSTLFYYDTGYTADWIWHAATELKIQEVNIDILTEKIQPTELEIMPIISGLCELRQTIKKVLTSNNFPPDFIRKATFQIKLSNELGTKRLLKVKCTTEDKTGKIFEGLVYNEIAFEDSFSFHWD